MGKKINIRPTTSVYATYKRLSYEPWSAIAEFIDNSTQSFYDHKEELLGIKYSKGLTIEINYIEDSNCGDRLEIIDNAYGMEWKDFQRAVVLDKPPKNTSGRNEFGMGLKTAACWFGAIWSVETTQFNSKNKYFTEINIDELGKYQMEEINVEEAITSARDHFTKVVISNLNQKINAARTIGKVKELICSIYREDLRSGLVKIYYNGILLKFKEPPVYIENCPDGSKKKWKKQISFSVEHEGKQLNVTGFIAIRIPASVKDAGFTLLRRGRVIVGGSEKNYRPFEIFGDSNSYLYQRLYGELNLDNWPVTQAKNNFDWYSGGLEEKFIEKLLEETIGYRQKATIIRIREKIDTNQLVKSAISGLEKSGLVNNIKIEIKNNEDNHDNIAPNSTELSENRSDDLETGSSNDQIVDENDSGVIFEGGEQVDFKFKYKTHEYYFRVIFDICNPSAHWLLVEPNELDTYTLIINMKHSFFKPLVEKKDFMPVMMRMSIALVLAEIEAEMLSSEKTGKIDACDIRLKMNNILDDVRKGGVVNDR